MTEQELFVVSEVMINIGNRLSTWIYRDGVSNLFILDEKYYKTLINICIGIEAFTNRATFRKIITNPHFIDVIVEALMHKEIDAWFEEQKAKAEAEKEEAE